MKFVPTESDKEWTRNLFRVLKVGGTWATSWAIYQRDSEDTLAVIMDVSIIYPKFIIEDNIERVKIAVESIGKKFIDRRLPNEPS